MSDQLCIVYVIAYCSIYIQIVLIMKDDGFADENVGWTCLPSTPVQSERFKFDVNISSIKAVFSEENYVPPTIFVGYIENYGIKLWRPFKQQYSTG